MSSVSSIALSLLAIAGGGSAFTPSAASRDARLTPLPSSLSYANGDPAHISWEPHSHSQNSGASAAPADPFETWAKMRLGLGTGPGSCADGVFWVGGGCLYEGYSGKRLATFEGFDVAKGVRLGDGHVRQLSRKIFWFRDPVTGEVMKEYDGKPVRPIVYNCQMIDYRRDEGGSISCSVEASPRLLNGELPELRIAPRMAGPHQMMINVPVFLDMEVPEERGGGRYRAWEFYDYNVDPSFPPDRPPTAVWCRQGSVPPFDVDSNAVLRFSGCRVDSYDELPERMREEVEREYPLFKTPPSDGDEVRFFSKR